MQGEWRDNAKIFLLMCYIATSYSQSFLQNIFPTYLWRFSFFLVHKPYGLSHMIHSLSFPTGFHLPAKFFPQSFLGVAPSAGKFIGPQIFQTITFSSHSHKNLTSVYINKLSSLASFHKCLCATPA